MGATDPKKKRQMRIWQTLIKIVPRRSSRKSQRDVLSPVGNISPRNSTEKIVSYEETTDDIELGDPHVSASSLSSSVHEREESTKEDAAAATRIQAVFRGHRVRLSNPTAFSFAIFLVADLSDTLKIINFISV